MGLKITKVNCPANKVAIKCPYGMKPTRIVIHNTANKASAMDEISYMLRNDLETSFHFAVDYERAVQGIDLNKNAWHAGDGGEGIGNRQGIAIEICHSLGKEEDFLKSERNGAILAAMLLKQYGWGIDKITKHQDYSGKYCPHKTLDLGWQRFLNMVQEELGSKPKPQPGGDQIIHVNSICKLDGVFRVDYMDVARNLVASSVLSNGKPFDYNWLIATPLYKCNKDGSNPDINGIFYIGDYFMCPDTFKINYAGLPTANEPNGVVGFVFGGRQTYTLADRIYEVKD